MKFMNYYYLDS